MGEYQAKAGRQPGAFDAPDLADTLVAPPLMVIDMMEDHAPFALDASLAEVAETIPYGYGPKPKKNGKKSG